MRPAIVNGRWNIVLPDSVADWDAITGSYAERSGWEFKRMESMQRTLHYGDCVFDVGTEHGWLAGIIGREFVGSENLVLFEPSPEFWINIRRIWRYNNLDDPFGFWPGFVSDEDVDLPDRISPRWPPQADGEHADIPGMPYRSLVHHSEIIPSIKIDTFTAMSGIHPKALNIDVEGAEGKVLRGASTLLRHPASHLEHVWVSVHPDLMVRDFNETQEDLHKFMDDCGWWGTFLGRDHEDHWYYRRK